jgi:hypothetical protein
MYWFYEYYYFVFILQGICLFHAAIKNNLNPWLWLIVFLPGIGSLVYIFTQIIRKSEVKAVQSEVAKIVTPGAQLKKLEKQYQFSNTFANRIALADAYLASGMSDKAIALYEESLTGMFIENESVNNQLICAYYEALRYDDIIRIAPRVEHTVNFDKHRACFCYAVALEKSGNIHKAETFFRKLDSRYANFEYRYYLGEFLIRNGKTHDAEIVFDEMIEESKRMSGREKRPHKQWIDKAQHRLNEI